MNLLLRYIRNIFVPVDELGNAIAGGSPHETISSRLGRNYRGSFLEKLVDKLLWFEPNHCEAAAEKEKNIKGLDAIIAQNEEKGKGLDHD